MSFDYLLQAVWPSLPYFELGTIMVFMGSYWVRNVEEDSRWYGLALVISGVLIDVIAWRYFVQFFLGGGNG